MTDKPELEIGTEAEQGFRESTVAHNDAADGFEHNTIHSPLAQDPGERLRGDPEAEADDDDLEAALDRAMESFRMDDLKLSEFETLVRGRLASFGPSLGDRLEQLGKQLARLEANTAFVVSYVNTLALPVRDPLDLPDPPASAAEFIETMKAAEADLRGRHNSNTLPGRKVPRDPGRTKYTPADLLDAVDELRKADRGEIDGCIFTDAQLTALLDLVAPQEPTHARFPNCPPYVPAEDTRGRGVPLDAGVPHDIGQVNPNDPIDCQRPNDCQFPSCLCGTEIAAKRSEAIASTRGPYAHVYDQNHAEPACTHKFTSGAGGVAGHTVSGGSGGSPGRTSFDGSHPMTLSADDVCMLRDQAALTEVLAFMDRLAGHPDSAVPMTLTPTEFRAVRQAVAREVGSTPLPDPHPLAYRIPNDMAQVLDSLRVALHSVTTSGLPGADVHLSKAELRSLMAVVRGFKPTEQLPEPLRAGIEVHVTNKTNDGDGFSDNDRARKVLHDCEAALNDLAPNTYEPTRLLFTAQEIACACAVLRQGVGSPLIKPTTVAASTETICNLHDAVRRAWDYITRPDHHGKTKEFAWIALRKHQLDCLDQLLSGAPTPPYKADPKHPDGNAYWLGSDGKFYVLDPTKARVPYEAHKSPQVPVRPLTQAERSQVTGQPSQVPSFQTIADAIASYWWDHSLGASALLQPTDAGWRLTARAADSLASHITNVITGAPNWPSPMAEAVGTPARGPEVLSGYDARTRASPPTKLASMQAEVHKTVLDRDETIIRDIDQLAAYLTKVWDDTPTGYTTAVHLRPKVIIELLRYIGDKTRFPTIPGSAQAQAEVHKAQLEVVSDPPTFVHPFNHASPLHEAIYELSRELEHHQANPKDEQDRTRAIAILMSPAALSIAVQACQRLNTNFPLFQDDKHPKPSLLDQARETHDAIWTRLLTETHIPGTLRDNLTAPAFHRAWSAIASLVEARHVLHTDDHVETLVLRLDAVRAVHKVLLCVRSALLHSGNT